MMKKTFIFTVALALSSIVLADPFAYVTNYVANSISIVDLDTNEAIGYVDNGAFDITYPVDVRHAPDGTKAYLVSDYSNAMFVIDTSTDTIVSQIDSSTYSFSAPVVACFTPDGTKAYVANEGTNQLSIIDVATDTITGYVTDSIASFNCPIGIAFSPDGTLAYVANFTGNTVSIIDVATDTVTGLIDSSTFNLVQPVFLNFIDNTKAYVASLSSGQVGIIDVVNSEVVGYVDPGSNFFSLPFFGATTPDGMQEVFIDAGVPAAFGWSPSTDTVANAVSGLTAPRFCSISADSTLAYFPDVNDNAVYIVDLSTYTITGSFDGSTYPFTVPYAISISP